MVSKSVSRTIEETLANAIRLMFENMKSGDTTNLAFSRGNLHILVFVMAMSIIVMSTFANTVVDLLIDAQTIVQITSIKIASMPIFVIQFILSTIAVVAGFWLFLKGVNIASKKNDGDG
ncbi:MAG: hypothetical protein OIN85_09270 [Candidatus Methanoperedens sp.]|nr:hypothetical protein [Candidatus Methanoperedens sp.]